MSHGDSRRAGLLLLSEVGVKIRIDESLSPLVQAIDLFEPYPGNPREGDTEAIRRSLRRFGQKKPIVARDLGKGKAFQIVAGNHLWAAMKEEEMETIAASVSRMSDEDAQAYLIADNRTAELGGYNEVDLAQILGELRSRGDLEGTGYNDRQVEQFLARVEREMEGDRPELEFSSELMEEHQFLVLYFDNALDWKSAIDSLGISTVKAWDATSSYERKGIGRVVRGTDAIQRLRG